MDSGLCLIAVENELIYLDFKFFVYRNLSFLLFQKFTEKYLALILKHCGYCWCWIVFEFIGKCLKFTWIISVIS